jgi:hypothetical protein
LLLGFLADPLRFFVTFVDIIYMAQEMKEIEVEGPAGGLFTVITEDEKDQFEKLAEKYQKDNSFQNVSDLQDLERVIHTEVLALRYMNWLSIGNDYFGDPIDEKLYGDLVRGFHTELRQLKKAMGMDKTSRLKEAGLDVSDYVENLKARAKQFGVMRNKQHEEALTLFHELAGKIILMDNCTENEKKEQGVTETNVIDWIREEAMPKFREVDKHFVDTQQRYWIKEM